MSIDWYRRRGLLALCATAALATGVSACGSDDSSDTASTGSAAEATAAADGSSVVAEATKKAEGFVSVDKIGPTVPIGKPIPKGKKLVFVNCGAPACTNQAKAFKAAAAKLGWSVKEIASQPTPEAIQGSFDEAIRLKPDGVASAGFGRSLYPKQLDELKQMGIPVMSITGTEETGEGGIAFEPLGPKRAAEATAVLADKAIADMGGEGEAGSVLLGGYPIVKDYTKGYTDEIKSACPKCTVKQIEIQPTSLGKDAPQKIANFLRANPNIKSLFLSYDLLGSGLPAAAKGAGVTVPKTYSWAPDAPGLQDLKTGARTASVLMPHPELAWQIIDAFARTFTGRDVSESQTLQKLLIVGKDNNNVPAKAEPFPSSVPGFEEQFMSLWGVQ